MAVNVKWTVLENKFKELPGDQQKVLLGQMTQLVEGHSTMVEMRAPEIQTETRGRPPGSRNLPKATQSETYPSSNISNRWSLWKKESVSAGVK